MSMDVTRQGISRRVFLGGMVAGAGALAGMPSATLACDVKLALTNSNLIYLTPVKSDGSLSSCQSEIWYAMLGADIFVCTATSSWRARAAERGLDTKIWVGDLGYWKRVDYTKLPSTMASSSRERDPATIDAALGQFGRKYSDEWGTWGPRFSDGLADGTRSMLRYRLI